MAQFFIHEDGCHYGSIPTLPLILESYVICAFKSIGHIDTGYRYIKKIGQVLRIISPDDPAHPWWEVQKADGYATPEPLDTIVIVTFPEIGEEMFLPKDLVHVTPVNLN
jgi:hypothetical protein